MIKILLLNGYNVRTPQNLNVINLTQFYSFHFSVAFILCVSTYPEDIIRNFVRRLLNIVWMATSRCGKVENVDRQRRNEIGRCKEKWNTHESVMFATQTSFLGQMTTRKAPDVKISLRTGVSDDQHQLEANS